MPVSFTFYSLVERQPEHLEEVVWMRPVNACGSEGFDPRQIQVEYSWAELDENGWDTGTSFCYSEETKDHFSSDKYRLDILFDGNVGDTGTYWCSIDDYFDTFDGIVN